MDTLDQIGRRFGSDKFTRHGFGPIYDRMFGHVRTSAAKILEIGIGGEDYALGGESLSTWKEYFTNAEIVGIDIYDKQSLETDRIKTEICDQRNTEQVNRIALEHGPFDVIIDDGSHIGSDAISSLKTLFHYLRPGGIYVIEDVQTSYWSNYGGSSVAPNWFDTTVKWLKGVIDIINKDEYVLPSDDIVDYELEIAELHIFHNIAFIMKDATPDARRSRVLTGEMRLHISQHDNFHNEGFGSVYSLYQSSPDLFRRLMRLVSSVLAGVESRFEAEESFRPKSESILLHIERLEAELQLGPTSSSQMKTIDELQNHIITLTGYIEILEDGKSLQESITSARGVAIDDYVEHVAKLKEYIENLEDGMKLNGKIMSDRGAAIHDYVEHVAKLQGYIESLEGEKLVRERVLASHVAAVKSYEAYSNDLKDHIRKIEKRECVEEIPTLSHPTDEKT